MNICTKLLAVFSAAILLPMGFVYAQSVIGVNVVSSLVGSFSLGINTPGPQFAAMPLNGGTFTCAGNAATVANTNVNAGSLILMTLKTAGGTVSSPYVSSVTAGTGFAVTCGGMDTSTYNFIILG